MKQSLIILSSITTLTLASNASLNIINSSIVINNKLNSNPKDIQPSPSVFNNTFGKFSQDNWITNQSTSDHKYYSYDTSHAVGKLSDGTLFRNAFIVYTNGDLIINPALKLSYEDKNKLDNICSQMISDRKVTTIKDFSNLDSKSEYSENYFSGDISGDNSNWKYLQMGGVEKHIDISSEWSACKVENYKSLSEAWGLYYIAKARRAKGGIDMAVAKDLSKYFINQSSLKNLDINLIYKIIDLIATNDDVYNLFNTGPGMNKNNSANYIFDSKGNLVEVYYNQWTNNNINKDIDYKYSKSYNGTSSISNFDGSNIVLLDSWKKYAHDWASFIELYPTLTFDNNSYIEVSSQYNKSSLASIELGLDTNSNSTDNYKLWYNKIYHDGGPFFGAFALMETWVYLTHDANNIYLKWHINEHAEWATEGLHFKIGIGNCSFNNIMN